MKLTELTPEEYSALEASALALLKEGQKQAAVRQALGLNHSQLDLIVYRNQLTEEDFARFVEGGGTLGERVAVARNVLKLSWGVIGLLAGQPESKIRKAYADQTAHDSRGQRIGKGGAHLMREPGLYEKELNPTGTVLPAGKVYDRAFALQQARVQRIYKLDLKQLRELGAAYGVAFKKGQTKTTFTKALLKAITAEGTFTPDEAVALVAEPAVAEPAVVAEA